MADMRTVWRGAGVLGTGAVTLALIGGCGSTTGGTAIGVTPTVDHTCTEVSAPMAAIDSTSPEEPQLRVPQPQGWERRKELDSKIIRFVMVNNSLASDNFAANAVVTFEPVTGDTESPKQLLDGQRANLADQLKATDISGSDGTQCGYPATTITYSVPATGTTPARKAKVLGVVIESADKTYLTTVTVGSADDDSSTYAKDSETILKGFAITAR